MIKSKRIARVTVAGLAMLMASAWTIQSAMASMIGTYSAVQSENHAALVDQVSAKLDREAVREQFIELGVEPAHVQSRLDQLTDEELLEISNRIDEMPAGAGVLGVLGAVLVVLLVLELLGVTNVFTRL